MRFSLWLLMAFVLGACAAVPDTAEEAALRERPEQRRMHSDLVRGMLAQGQHHAALAHIEELERAGRSDPQELAWLRASALFKLDQLAEAKQEYRALLDSRFAGQAHHGLGLIAARDDLRSAVSHFNQAVRLRPTDADIRNDLGYTLLMAGRLTEARHHLATAVELAPGTNKSQSNLVLSFLADGRYDEAGSLARSFGLDDEQMRRLRAESLLIRRLMAQRAQEFSAPAEGGQGNETVDSRQSDRESIPGLYRKRQ